MEPIRGTDDAGSATRTHHQFRFALFVQRNVCRARTTVKHSFCSFLPLVHFSLSLSLSFFLFLFTSRTTRMSASLSRVSGQSSRWHRMSGSTRSFYFRTMDTRLRREGTRRRMYVQSRSIFPEDASESDESARGGGLNRVSVSGALTRRNEARRNAVKGPIPITFPDQFCNFR